jgi:hypothetical protein
VSNPEFARTKEEDMRKLIFALLVIKFLGRIPLVRR